MCIVWLAPRRTSTFIVMALLIGLLGLVSIHRRPTDISPETSIPVVSVVWQFVPIAVRSDTLTEQQLFDDANFIIQRLGTVTAPRTERRGIS
jgi:hypothetical protein